MYYKVCDMTINTWGVQRTWIGVYLSTMQGKLDQIECTDHSGFFMLKKFKVTHKLAGEKNT
jgi:hypothetical protein